MTDAEVDDLEGDGGEGEGDGGEAEAERERARLLAIFHSSIDAS